MKKIMKLSESDLTRIVKRIISEETMDTPPPFTKGRPSGQPNTSTSQFTLRPCKPGESGTLIQKGNVYALSKGSPFCQIMS